MNGVISVIIPVYNVAEYLPQCMESLLTQDYEKLEVILIDDGSKDNSDAICDAYAEKDSRVKVINQLNSGHVPPLLCQCHTVASCACAYFKDAWS